MKKLAVLLPSAMFVAALIAMSGLMVAGSSVHGANIAWTQVIVDSTDNSPGAGTGLGDAAVSTSGTLVEAANFGTLTDVTVNGVLFKGINFTVPPTNLSIGYASTDNSAVTIGGLGTTTGGAIDTVTHTFSRKAGVGVNTAMLTGLTIGQQYEVQFIASFDLLARSTTFSDGNGNTIVQPTNNPHSFSTGTFTADATTQTVIMTASAGSQFLSAYQLRAIPEPTSAILAMMGLAGILAAARRHG